MNITNTLPCTDGFLVAPSRELEGQQISHIFEIEYFTEAFPLRSDMSANEEDICQRCDEAGQQEINPLSQPAAQLESITAPIYLKIDSTSLEIYTRNRQEEECTLEALLKSSSTNQSPSTEIHLFAHSTNESTSDPLIHTAHPISEEHPAPLPARAPEKEPKLYYEEHSPFTPINPNFLSAAAHPIIEHAKKINLPDNISDSEIIIVRERQPSASIIFQKIDRDIEPSFYPGPQLANSVKTRESLEIDNISNVREPISFPVDQINPPRSSEVKNEKRIQIQDISDRTLIHPIESTGPDTIYEMYISENQDQPSDIQSSSSFPVEKISDSSGLNPPLVFNSRAVAGSTTAARSMDTDRSDTGASKTETSTHTTPVSDRSMQSQIQATAEHTEGADNIIQTISKPHPLTTPHNEIWIVASENDSPWDGEDSVASEMSTTRPHRSPISLSGAVDLAINRIVRNELGEVEIVLSPEELGTIRINISGSERLQVHFIADRTETIDLMRRNSDLLEQKLQSDGFGGAEVSFSFSSHSHDRHKRDQKDVHVAQIGADETPSPALPVTNTLSRPNPLGTSINIRL